MKKKTLKLGETYKPKKKPTATEKSNRSFFSGKAAGLKESIREIRDLKAEIQRLKNPPEIVKEFHHVFDQAELLKAYRKYLYYGLGIGFTIGVLITQLVLL